MSALWDVSSGSGSLIAARGRHGHFVSLAFDTNQAFETKQIGEVVIKSFVDSFWKRELTFFPEFEINLNWFVLTSLIQNRSLACNKYATHE